MNQKVKLPVTVLETPHWRVNFRPNLYNEELIKSLGECFGIIEKTKLSLGGWDYPFLGLDQTEKGQGSNWVASWVDFGGNREYWRFYRSGQFIHLFSINEAISPRWSKKIKTDMQSKLYYMDRVNWDEIPGFILVASIINKITEIYEFVARLCEKQIYTGKLNIRIELKGIKGFVLAPLSDRHWRGFYKADEGKLSIANEYESDHLMANCRDESLKAIVWFFERFGWFSPPIDVIRHDQENFLAGKF